MAVHNEHNLRSFPSFCEADNYDDDDEEENNFIICLDSSEDEQKQNNVTHVSSSVNPIQHKSHNNFLNPETSTNIPLKVGVESIYHNSNSVISSNVDKRDISAYQQFIVPAVKNINPTEPQPDVYSSLKENWRDTVLPDSCCRPVSDFESGTNYQDTFAVTVSCSSGSTETAFSPNCAGDLRDQCKSLPGSLTPQLVSSEGQDHQLQDRSTHPNVSQQIPPTSSEMSVPKPPSELSKMHLETIHLSKETGGMWSEAVFLTTVGMSDGNFSDNEKLERADRDNTIHRTPPFMTSNISSSLHSFSSPLHTSSSCVPKLSGPYPHNRGSEIDTQRINSAVENGVQKMQPLNKKAQCPCVMCYKGSGIVEPSSDSQIVPMLTEEEEEHIIFAETSKRKRLSTVDNKKDKFLLTDSCDIGIKGLSTIYNKDDNFSLGVKGKLVNWRKKKKKSTQMQNTVGGIRGTYVYMPAAAAPHTTLHSRSIIDRRNVTTQPKSLSDITTQNTLMIDVDNRNKSIINPVSFEIITADVSPGIRKSQCEKPANVVTGSNVTSMVVTTPDRLQTVSIPRFRSNPTKVFLKPSEVPGLRSQNVLSPELSSNNKLIMSNSGIDCLPQTAVTCKAASPQTSTSPSAKLSSPPSYKIIYVSPDQVLVCPNQTNTSVNLMSNSKQPQAKTQHFTVQLPQTSIQNNTVLSQGSNITKLPYVLTKNSQLCLNGRNNPNPSSLITVSSFNKQTELRHVLKNAEKVDISSPGRVLIKLKPSLNTQGPHQGSVHTSHPITDLTANAATPVSTNSAQMSLLKDFKSPSSQIQKVGSTPGFNLSRGGSIPSNTGQNIRTTVHSSTAPKPTKMEVTQALMCLIKSHFQEQSSVSGENVLARLIKGDLQTSQINHLSHESSPALNNPHKVKIIDNNISDSLRHHVTSKPTEDKRILISPERDKQDETDFLANRGTVSNPCLPQEGLPSTYVEDWVNKAKSYVSEHINESDCVDGSQNINQSICSGVTASQHEALITFPENSEEYSHRPQINKIDSSILESQNLQLSSKSNPSQTHRIGISEPSPANSSSIPPQTKIRQLDQSQTLQIAREQSTKFYPLQTKSHVVTDTSKKSSQPETTRVHFAETSRSRTQSSYRLPLILNRSKRISHQNLKSRSSSSIINSSDGIKLKIKLSDFRSRKTKYNHSFNTLESRLHNGESQTVPTSTDEFSLQKRTIAMDQETITKESEKETDTPADSSKTETAEEMFQRFQKQAEQEVMKAQMGMGYLSRSLRPVRNNLTFVDKYQYRFDTVQQKKKSTIEDKSMCVESKKTGEDSHCSVSEIDQQIHKNSIQNNKPSIRNKRQTDEECNKEIKQPKLSAKEYPNLNQDCSITNRKTLVCSNILAGHKVFVKFNTYENMNTGRSFLIPFFNIGGARTQFDVEDMEYINQAVVEFEKEERSCARHLLFYAREGHKAAFLRKETHFQTSHVSDKNYRKSSFILEGFKRDARKQPEPSPESWKVDNTVDIEIDRAEIDNDAEMEFDTNISYDDDDDDDVNELEGCVDKRTIEQVEKPLQQEIIKSKDPQNISLNEFNPSLPYHITDSTHKKGIIFNGTSDHTQSNKYSDFSVVNMEDSEIDKLHKEKESISNHQEQLKATVVLERNDSLQCSGKSSYRERLEEILAESRYQNTDGNKAVQVQLEDSVTHPIVKQEAMSDESDIPCLFDPITLSTVVKEEQLDYDYDDSTRKLYRSIHAADDNNLSSNLTSDHNQQLFPNCNISIKKEPQDDYNGWSVVEIQPISSEDHQSVPSSIETEAFQRVGSVSESHTIHFSQTSAAQPKLVNCSIIKEIRTSSSIAGEPESFTFNPQPTCSNILQSHTSEAGAFTSQTLKKTTDNNDSSPTKVRDLESCALEPTRRNLQSETTCDFADSSEETKTVSDTEPSLPESPLPSSSMSESSEISSSSDIDEKHISPEPDGFGVSETCLSNSMLAAEDGNKLNSIQSKITSLVESLRHRLTQETSPLPIWLADTSTSTVNTTVRKRKRSQINTHKENVQNNILPPPKQVINDISNTTVDLPTTHSSQIMSSLTTPSLISSKATNSLDQVKSLSSSVPPAVPVTLFSTLPVDMDDVSSATICTSSLPLFSTVGTQNDTFNTTNPVHESTPNKNRMLLPVKWPQENQYPLVKHAAVSSQSDHTYHELSSNECLPQIIKDQVTDYQKVPQAVIIDKNHTTKTVTFSNESTAICVTRYAFQNKLDNRSSNSIDGKPDTELPSYLEDLNSNRQSPVDLEIEVGNEDLPETALRLQSIRPDTVATLEEEMDEEPYPLNHLQSSKLNNASRHPSAFSRLKTDRKEQAEIDEHRTNTKSYLKHYSKADTTHDKGSVTNYLYQKFSFSGTGNKIKGPRLLHMPANRKIAVKQHNNQRTQKQNMLKVNTPSEPITTTELSTAPSVVEIFGASTENITAANKMDSTEMCTSQVTLNNNNSCFNTEQMMVDTSPCQVQGAKKTTVSRRTGRKRISLSNIRSGNTSAVKQNTLSSTVKQAQSNQVFNEIKNTLQNNESVSSMRLCKIVLTKLEKMDLLDYEKVSENVFIMKKQDTSIKDEPKTSETNELDDNHPQTCNSQSTLTKVVKKKRKKGCKGSKKPVRPKRDIVDYYTIMLENLQKKAQQLEEESLRKSEQNALKDLESKECKKAQQLEEESLRKSEQNALNDLESKDCKKRVEKQISTSGDSKHEEILEGNCEDLKRKSIIEETKVESLQEVCKMDVQLDCLLQVTMDNKHVVPSTGSETVINSSLTTNGTFPQEGSDGSVVKHESYCGKLEHNKVDPADDATLHMRNVTDDAKLHMWDVTAVAKLPTQDVTDVAKLPTQDVTDDSKLHMRDVTDDAKLPTRDVTDGPKLPTCDVDQTGNTKLPAHDVTEATKLIIHDVDRIDHAKLSTWDVDFTDDDVDLADDSDSPKEKCQFVLQSEAGDMSHSSWPFLQKFCDETIFNQGSTDYLQKVTDEVCFPKTTRTAGDIELTFGKKDVVLGGSVHDEPIHSELSTSETLNETEDIDCCMENSGDEQGIDHMEDEEILLSLDIPKNSTFSNDEHETNRNPFLLTVSSDNKHTTSLIENEDIAASKMKPEPVLTPEVMNGNAENNDSSLPSSLLGAVSCPAEPGNSRVDTCSLNGTSQSCTTQPSTHRPVTMRNVEVSPSWERLLGHTSLNIKQSLSSGHLSSHCDDSTNQNISFAASNNFKFKFKLPTGFLSKAAKMSRDMKHVFEGPSLELGSQALPANSSTHHALESSSGSQALPANSPTHALENSLENQALSPNCSIDHVIENSVRSQAMSSNVSIDQPLVSSLRSHSGSTNSLINHPLEKSPRSQARSANREQSLLSSLRSQAKSANSLIGQPLVRSLRSPTKSANSHIDPPLVRSLRSPSKSANSHIDPPLVRSLRSPSKSSKSLIDQSLLSSIVSSLRSQAKSSNSPIDQPLVSSLKSQAKSSNSLIDQSLLSSLRSQAKSTNSRIDQPLESKKCLQNINDVTKCSDDLSAVATVQTFHNQNAHVTSQTSVPELKLSLVTRSAIQKAKTEFLQKRKRGRKPKQKMTVHSQSPNVPDQAAKHQLSDADIQSKLSDRDQSSMEHQETSSDSHKKLITSNSRSNDMEVSNLITGNDLQDLREESSSICSNQHTSGHTEFQHSNENSSTQSRNVIFSESILHTSRNTTDNEVQNVDLKQNRTCGIFSNIDLLQGFNHEHSEKELNEPTLEKDVEVKVPPKTNIIDINKLKLKLNPLIFSKLKKRSVAETQPMQEHGKSSLKNGTLPEMCNVPDSSITLENFDKKMKVSNCESTPVINVTQSNDCIDGELETNLSEQHNFISSKESPDSISLLISKPIPQVNATKLCNIFKNFHKNANISSQMPTNPGGVLPEINGSNSIDKTETASSHCLLEKSNQLSIPASTSEMKIKMKGRKMKKRARLSQINKTKVEKEAEEKTNQILATSFEKVVLPGNLSVRYEENICDSETLRNDEKGERSFFDCLSSVPMDVWEEK